MHATVGVKSLLELRTVSHYLQNTVLAHAPFLTLI
jgi:hypothetical protein